MQAFRHAFLAILLVLSLLPVSTGVSAAASDTTLEIRLKLGEDQILINNESVKIEKPYVNNGTTLVPLRVITTAFGAALTWDSETQTVGLKYGEIFISLKIGSTTATVNGKKEELEAAPELSNGTTMVPLRFISEKFGAAVSFDDATSSISITGKQSGSTETTNIDTDLGKTHIGNSFFGWSMKYPSGLVHSYQSFEEDYVAFEDADGEFDLDIYVDTDQIENLSPDRLLKLLSEDVSETIIEKKYVQDSARPHARIVTKEDGTVYEYRAYQSGDKVFYLYLTINEEENFKNPSKYNGYKDLLDSFKPVFDRNDKTLKDLSNVKNGLRTFKDSTYEISLKLPAEWERSSDEEDTLTFSDKKGSNSFGIRVTSKASEETLQTWTERNQKHYTELFAPDYRKIDPDRALTIDGNQAIARRTSNTFDTTTWDATENVYLIKGEYKYFIYFQFNKQSDYSQSFIDITLQSIVIGKPSSSIGTIKDMGEDLDRTKTSLIKNKAYNYSVSIPDYWDSEFNKTTSGMQQYSYNFGKVLIYANENVSITPDKALNSFKEGLLSRTKDIKELSSPNETVAGVQGAWFVAELNHYITTAVAFQKDGFSYLIVDSHSEAVDTEQLKATIKNMIRSFQTLN